MKRKATLIRIFGYLLQHKRQLAFILSLSFLGNLLALAGPRLSGAAINLIAEGMDGSMDLPGVYKYAAFMLLFYVSSSLMSYAVNVSMITLSRRITYTLRKDTFNHLVTLPVSFFDGTTTGDILSRISYDIDTINASLSNDVVQVVSSSVTIVGSLVMMLRLSPRLVLVFAVTIPLALLLASYLTHMVQPMFRARSRAAGELNGYVEEMYSGHNVVTSYNAIESTKEEFAKLNHRLYDSIWKSQFISGIMMPIMMFIGNFSYALVIIVGAALALNGQISIGIIVAFMAYVRIFSQPLSQIAQGVTSLQQASAAMGRVFEFLAEEEMEDESHKERQLSDMKGQVVFDRVSFGYTPERTIIHDFSATAHAGQKVAIVGPTGAGKTTIVNLLMKFYEIDKGSIRIDGVDTKEMKRSEVHDVFSMVLQDTWLFEGTIRDNLIYNQTGISDERVIEASKAVGIHHFIMTLPDGYDTVLDDTVTLSVGQKQLLTIARALLKDAPLLILDEATSSVDTRTEELIQKAMDRLMEGRTSFVIAHRLSTIRNADLILVMKDGNIIEQGNHEELMAQAGFYADLYNSQFTEDEAEE